MVGITLGDPGGIGAEITLKALKKVKGDFILIGNRKALEYYASILNLEIPEVEIVDIPGKWSPGKISKGNGKIAGESIIKAVELWKEGKIKAVVTAPVNKKALHIAGFNYPGQTEFLAELTRTEKFCMLMHGKVNVAFVTTHLPLRDVRIKKEKVIEKIEVITEGLNKYFEIENPLIDVLSLNPHGGEEGDLGREEIEEIRPAVEEAREMGFRVRGPFPSDTYWCREDRGDCVVAMYHDQGMIPFKILSFGEGVNVTLGLPFLRTSPDHGTAFDIVGKGIASERSMVHAIELAQEAG